MAVRYRVLKLLGDNKRFGPLSVDAVFDQYVENVSPRAQAEADALEYVAEASGRKAIVVAEIRIFESFVTLERPEVAPEPKKRRFFGRRGMRKVKRNADA